MQTFSLTLQQRSMSLAVPAADVMLMVIVMARATEAYGLQTQILGRELPAGTEPGKLLLRLEPRPGGRQGLFFSIELAARFTTVDLRDNPVPGPLYCEAMVRQTVNVQRLPVDPNQAHTIAPLDSAYARAFRQGKFDGVEQSWSEVAAYAASYQIGRLDARFDQVKAAIVAGRAEVGALIERGNIEQLRGRSTRFRTLIQDELEAVVQHKFIVRPDEHNPDEYLLYTMHGGRVMSGDHQSHPSGKHNFVVLGGDIIIGGSLGHFWLSNGGKDVGYAGSVRFASGGGVKEWDNDSGHFKPHPGLAIEGPFPIRLFKATHVGLLVEQRAVAERALQARLAREPLDAAIDEAFLQRGSTVSARASLAAITAKLKPTIPDISNRKISTRMNDMGAITDLKTMNWDPGYEP